MTIRVNKTELAAMQAAAPPRRRRSSRELEHREQCQVVEWARVQSNRLPELKLLYAIPNGGQRNKATAGKLRAEGVKAGVSDLCLPVARRGYHGLYLEMKSPKGSVSDLQHGFMCEVSEQGYCATVAFGADQGIQVLEWYLGLRNDAPIGVI